MILLLEIETAEAAVPGMRHPVYGTIGLYYHQVVQHVTMTLQGAADRSWLR